MVILQLETSTKVCSAAWSLDGITRRQLVNLSDGQHARELPLFIENLLAEIRANGMPLDAVAIGAGPGSYTGLRIATATAKGLCYALNIPHIAIDTLQILAEATDNNDALVCPMIDARRMEVYTALYNAEKERVTDIEAKIIDENSFSNILDKSKILFCGDGADKCKKFINHPNAVFIENIVPEARWMSRLARIKFEHGEFENTAYYNPLYLKEYQAIKSKNKVL